VKQGMSLPRGSLHQHSIARVLFWRSDHYLSPVTGVTKDRSKSDLCNMAFKTCHGLTPNSFVALFAIMYYISALSKCPGVVGICGLF
jgi:hypothetical protein